MESEKFLNDPCICASNADSSCSICASSSGGVGLVIPSSASRSVDGGGVVDIAPQVVESCAEQIGEAMVGQPSSKTLKMKSGNDNPDLCFKNIRIALHCCH